MMMVSPFLGIFDRSPCCAASGARQIRIRAMDGTVCILDDLEQQASQDRTRGGGGSRPPDRSCGSIHSKRTPTQTNAERRDNALCVSG